MASTSTNNGTTVASKISNAGNGIIDGATEIVTYTVPAIINGKEITLKDTFDVYAPSTGKLLHHCSSVSVEDAISAVEAAHAAFPAWRDSTPSFRRDILLKTADIMERRSEELAKYMDDETGSTAAFSSKFNVPITVDGLRDIAGRISGLVGTAPSVGEAGKSAIVYKEPYGVILGIAPWYVEESYRRHQS
jgi:acyl-CoA reductase-like NAD-dependent aldehyde dehydrogenase